MKGVLAFINPKGYGFIEVVDEAGSFVRYFALRRRVLRHPDWWSAGAICEFQVSPEPPKRKGGFAEAMNIEIVEPGPGYLDSRVLRGDIGGAL